jgi:aarF domain-containing kinase
MMPAPSSSSLWKIASGASLVAHSVLTGATKDASKVAVRASRHGNDVLSKGGITATSAVLPASAAIYSILEQLIQNEDIPMTVKSGTAPYLRRKSNSATERKHVTKKQERSDPYAPHLFHSTTANTSTIQTAPSSEEPFTSADHVDEYRDRQRLKEGRAVPSTRVGRALGFARLGAGLLWGSMAGGGPVNDANADRLAATLCRMRGAALKLGQMLSIQDESLLPPPLTRALQQVRQGAEAMPAYQLRQQLQKELGETWREKFTTFDDLPFAAASIGQVHYAEVMEHGKTRPTPVVVKVQYPGVADSINSDLGNLAMLFRRLAPRGLFLDNVIRVGRDELEVECRYDNEAASQDAMRELVTGDVTLRENKVHVPRVFHQLSTGQVLTTEFARGKTIDNVVEASQEERDRIGRTILYLTMQELFEWRLMQTDPNWGNFLYDPESGVTTLIDFGATRSFPKEFVDGYLRIVWASANRDEETLLNQSYRMGFLTGEENDSMLEAHKWSGFTVGEPFHDSGVPFDFGASQISSRMGEHTSVFLKHRLTPPPEEVYTLHRKLAGAYMLCIKLGAVIECRDMLESVVRNHVFEDGLPNPTF